MSKFKGYARNSGFKEISLPNTARRIEEEGERTLRRMENDFKIRVQNAQENIDSLNQKYRVEEKNRDFVFDLESENRNQIRSQMVENMKVARENANTEQENIRSKFEGIAAFSQTAAKISGDLFTEMTERRQKRGEDLANVIAMAGLNFADVDYIRKIEKANIENDENYRLLIEKLRQAGASSDVIKSIRESNASTFYGMKKTMLVNAGLDYPEYLAAKEADYLLNPDGTPTNYTLGQARGMGTQFNDAIEAQELRNTTDYITEFGETSDPMVSRFLYPKMVEAERAANRGRSARQRQLDEQEAKVERTQKWNTIYDDAQSPEDAIDSAWQHIQVYKRKGVAREEWLEAELIAVQNGRFADIHEANRYMETLENFEVSINGGPKRRFKDAFKNSTGLRDLRDGINTYFIELENQNLRLKSINDKRIVLSAVKAMIDSDGFTDAAANDFIFQIEKLGADPSEFKAILYANTIEADERQKVIDYIEEQKADGSLTLSTFNGIVDTKVLDEYKEDIARLTAESQGYSQSLKDVEKELGQVLKDKFEDDFDFSKGKTGFTFLRAKQHALRRYQFHLNDLKKSAGESTTLDDIQQQAKDLTIAEIRDEKGDFQTSSVTTAGDGFFIRFDPKNEEKYIPPDLGKGVSHMLNRVNAEPSSVINERFITTSKAKELAKKIQTNSLKVIPTLFQDLARYSGIPAEQILQTQIELAAPELKGKFTVEKDLASNVITTTPPEILNILENLNSENLRTAIVASGNKVHAVRTHSQGYSDVLSLTKASGFKAPHVAASMWQLETGGGKFMAGRNNLFNIKSTSGEGSSGNYTEFIDGQWTTQRSTFKDYESPSQSVEDYINTLKKYPGVNEANTPREMVQAIYDGGYATDPEYVNKVLRIARENGVNVDQPFIEYEGPATRDPNYGDATMQHIYNVHSIGWGSTGPHLDVKQLDNPNTPEDETGAYFEYDDPEIAEYLFVDDLEKGRVPLPQVPMMGSWESHANRSSNGYDYGIHDGRPIFLKPPARVIDSITTTEGDDMLYIELPSGRRFKFHHGKDPNNRQ
tara:strand:- start:41 stop:3190 length:3150 start_codon:yes stop_codon:yes gene_type:complete